MLEPVKFESLIEIKDVPLQWIPTFELYYPDLRQFPIVYIHIINNNNRIYGFPVSTSFSIIDDKTCEVEFLFLSNKDLENNSEFKGFVKTELEERFGIRDKIGIDDILSYCKGNKEYIAFFKELWKFFTIISGDYIPYGKFYEEIFSIIRFVSAWQPKTGRQSEMRMLYNFLSIFGEELEVYGRWSYLQIFLLPTYGDIKEKNLDLFEKFKILFSAMEKVWKHLFTKTKTIHGVTFKSLENSWPIQKEKFIQEISTPLFSKGILNIEEKHSFERLVDAFNRHGWRAAFFIFSLMTIFIKDYKTWDKKFFVDFYLGKIGVGCSEKVIACFLQQGFKNAEVIPLDIWIESFYQQALGIKTKEEFFNSFSNLGKLERVMWTAGQMKKTNIKAFFDTLWCIRYGDTGNNELRGANPIACYTCKLHKKCPSYHLIKNKKVILAENSNTIIEPAENRNGKVIGMKIASKDLIIAANRNICYFICIIEKNVPKKIFKKVGKKTQIWKLIDEFSSYLLTDQSIRLENCTILTDKHSSIDDYVENSEEIYRNFSVVLVDDLLDNLPSFFQ